MFTTKIDRIYTKSAILRSKLHILSENCTTTHYLLMQHLVKRIKQIDPKIGLLCLIYFLVAQSSMTARATSDSFLLKHFEPADISMMIMAAASLSILLALFSTYLCSRFQAFGAMQFATFGLSSAVVVAIALIFIMKTQPVFAFSYMICEVTVILPMVLFWGMAVGVLNPSESKKWFGLIGAAGTCGCIVAGYTVSLASKSSYVNELSLGIVAFLLLAVNFTLFLKGKIFVLPSTETKVSNNLNLFRKFAVLLSSRQSVLMTLLVVCSATVLSVIDINFKFEVRNDQEDLYDFFGLFYTYTSIAQLFLQLLVVRAILTKGGVLVAIGILPALLMVVSGFGIFFLFKDAIYVSKFFTQVVFFTIEYVGLQMLFLAVSKQLRGQMNSAVDGLTRPATIAIISLVIGYSLPFWNVGTESEIIYRINLVVISLCCVWVFVAYMNYKEYLRSLLNLLGSKKIDFSDAGDIDLDPKFIGELKKSFLESDQENALLLSEFAFQMKLDDWSKEFSSFLDHEDCDMRKRAYSYLARYESEENLSSILPKLLGEKEEIQVAFLEGSFESGKNVQYEFAEQFLSSPHNHVQCLSSVMLMNSAEMSLCQKGEEQFQKFLHSDNSEFQVLIAKSLRFLKTKDTSMILSGFLSQDKTKQQREALKCINEKNLENLFPRLLEMVSNDNSKDFIFNKLGEFKELMGNIIVPKLNQAFENDHKDDLALLLSFHLKTTEVEKSDQIEDYILHLSDHPQATVLETEYIDSILSSSPNRKFRKWAFKRVKKVLNDALDNTDSLLSVPKSSKYELFRFILDERQRNFIALIAKLLESQNPDVDFNKMFEIAVQKGMDAKSEVEEVLKGQLTPKLADDVLAVILAKSGGMDEKEYNYFYNKYSNSESKWLCCSLLLAMYSEDYLEYKDYVVNALDHKDPTVRESALYVFIQFEKDKSEVQDKCLDFRNDSEPSVSKIAMSKLSVI